MAAVTEEYSGKCSSTCRTHRSLTFGSIFFGMVRILPTHRMRPETSGGSLSLTEGDLVIGAGGGSAIARLVERSSRFLMLGRLGRERSAEAVRDSLIATVAQMPASLRKSLTWDQGAEMAEHSAFSTATDFKVHFADPGFPWQRGTNENTNGLLRQYLPRGVDLLKNTIEDLQAVAVELNGRPRKALDWDTPAERLAQLL